MRDLVEDLVRGAIAVAIVYAALKDAERQDRPLPVRRRPVHACKDCSIEDPELEERDG